MRLEDKRLKNLFIWRSRFKGTHFYILIASTITKCIEAWLDILYSIFKYDTNCMYEQAESHSAVVERSSGILEGPGSILTLGKLYIASFSSAICYSFSQNKVVLVIPRNRWLRLNMTEKLFTGTLNNNKTKQNKEQSCNNCLKLGVYYFKLDKSKRHIWWVFCTENNCCLSLNTCVTDRVVFKHRQVRRKFKMGYFSLSMGATSAVGGGICPNFELRQSSMYVLVNCKHKKIG